MILRRRGIEDITATARSGKGLGVTLLLFLFSLFLCESLCFGGRGLSVPILTGGLYLIALWFLRDSKRPASRFDTIMALPILLISASFFFNHNSLTYLIATLSLIFLVPAHLASLSGYSPNGLFSGGIIPDTLTSTIGNGFYYGDMAFVAMRKGATRQDGKKRRLGPVLLGLVLGLPVAIIFLIFYYYADEMFRLFLQEVIDRIGLSLWHVTVDIVLGFILTLLLCGWLISIKTLRSARVPSGKDPHRLNGLLVGAFFAMIAIVQLLFVLVQFRFLFAGEKSLPAGMNYAEYARHGFFEICWTIGISVVIVALALLLTRREENGRIHPLARISLSSCILCNYIIVASAIMRFILYIQEFGMSEKRVACVWLIALMAIGFAGTLIKVWVPKFRSMRYVGVLIVIMVAMLGFVNLDSLVANYNVDQYLTSENYEHELDMDYLASLGSGAAPAVARLIEKDTPNKELALSVLNQQKFHEKTVSWRNLTLSRMEAERVFKAHNITGTYADSYTNSRGYGSYDKWGYNSEGYDNEGYSRSGVRDPNYYEPYIDPYWDGGSSEWYYDDPIYNNDYSSTDPDYSSYDPYWP